MTERHAELEVAQRYAANRLTPDEAAAFEEHLLTCEQCQSETLMSVALGKVTREAPLAIPSRQAWWIAGGALLAAAIALFVILPSGTEGELASIGRVTDPPAYAGMNVRASRVRGDSLFAAAMVAYNARRYDDAAIGLRNALAAGVDSIPTTFFLASADLMAGRARDAADAFGRVIARGEAASAYLPEAHLFRARASLQLGRAEEALADLAAVDRSSEQRAAADSLAARVTGLIRR